VGRLAHLRRFASFRARFAERRESFASLREGFPRRREANFVRSLRNRTRAALRSRRKIDAFRFLPAARTRRALVCDTLAYHAFVRGNFAFLRIQAACFCRLNLAGRRARSLRIRLYSLRTRANRGCLFSRRGATALPTGRLLAPRSLSAFRGRRARRTLRPRCDQSARSSFCCFCPFRLRRTSSCRSSRGERLSFARLSFVRFLVLMPRRTLTAETHLARLVERRFAGRRSRSAAARL